jgi:hypothetical protein
VKDHEFLPVFSDDMGAISPQIAVKTPQPWMGRSQILEETSSPKWYSFMHHTALGQNALPAQEK